MKKVLATGLVLLIVLGLTAQPVRAQGLLTDFFEMIKNWFESSPLGNLFAMPVKRVEILTISFYPQTFELEISDPVNISTNTSEINNFKGELKVNMNNRVLYLQESGSQLSIKEKIGHVNVDKLKINSLDLKGMKLEIKSGNWDEITENGSITIKDFLGSAVIKEGVIELDGNVSKVVKA